MKEPPKYLDGAMVLFWSPINTEHIRTGKTRHYINGEQQTNFACLAIAAYGDDSGKPKNETYLFYCNDTWKVLNDTYHDSIEAAKEQAEFEYTGTKDSCIKT